MEANTTIEPEANQGLPVNPIPVVSNEVTETDWDVQKIEAPVGEAEAFPVSKPGEVAVITAQELLKQKRRFFEPSQPLLGPPVRHKTKDATVLEAKAQEVAPQETSSEVSVVPVTVMPSEQDEMNQIDQEDRALKALPTDGETVILTKYPVHPAAALFPMLDDDGMLGLAQDIKAHGLQHPIVRYQGQILDGRNRAQACQTAGVEPKFEEYTGDSPVAFVMSANLHRRQLDKSQLATLAVDIAPMLSEEAKKRQQGGVSVKVGERGKTLEKAAEAMNVSPAYAEKAKKIKVVAPEKFAAIRAGKKTVSQAHREIEAEAKANLNETDNDTIPRTSDTGEIVESNETDDATEPKNDFQTDVKASASQMTEMIVTELTPKQSVQVLGIIKEMGIDSSLYESLSAHGGMIRLTAATQEKLASSSEGEQEGTNPTEVSSE